MRFASFGLISLLSACSVPDTSSGNADSGAPGPKSTTKPLALSVSAAPPSVALADYVGKYPFDRIGGKTFLDRSEVRMAVKASGANADVRRWIFEDAGPQTPIAMRTGRLLSWGCQAHNCGSHNWTIFITKDGHDAEVCYHDDGRVPVTTWYADGKLEARTDECPAGDDK